MNEVELLEGKNSRIPGKYTEVIFIPSGSKERGLAVRAQERILGQAEGILTNFVRKKILVFFCIDHGVSEN